MKKHKANCECNTCVVATALVKDDKALDCLAKSLEQYSKGNVEISELSDLIVQSKRKRKTGG